MSCNNGRVADQGTSERSMPITILRKDIANWRRRFYSADQLWGSADSMECDESARSKSESQMTHVDCLVALLFIDKYMLQHADGDFFL